MHMQKHMRRHLAIVAVCLSAVVLFTACAGGGRNVAVARSAVPGARQSTSTAAGSRPGSPASGQTSKLNDVEKTVSDLNGTLNGLDNVSPGDVSLPD